MPPTPKAYQLQYTELWQARTGLTFGVEEVLLSRQSRFQRIEVLQTDAFGRVLLLDGLVMLTERDEFVYHEMIAHPALCLLERPRRALVIGGGDGGTVREVLRHPSIERVDLVEIDAAVVEAARAFFPEVSAALDAPRLQIYAEDGAAFVEAAAPESYDLVLVDSTDPVGMAESLFGEAFYRRCAEVLTKEGILVAQTESPFDPSFQDSIRAARRLLTQLFAEVHTYLAAIPAYPMGTWSFTMAAKGAHPVEDFDAEAAAARLDGFDAALRYYNPEVHRAAFALPNFAREVFA